MPSKRRSDASKSTDHRGFDAFAIASVTLLLMLIVAILCYLELTGHLYFATDT